MKAHFAAISLCLAIILPPTFVVLAAPAPNAIDSRIAHDAQATFEEGRQIFRYDTFGSEAFWGDTLQLHKAIAGGVWMSASDLTTAVVYENTSSFQTVSSLWPLC